MLHKQAKNYLFIKKVQKYLRAKSDLCYIMTGVTVPNPVTWRMEPLYMLRCPKLEEFNKCFFEVKAGNFAFKDNVDVLFPKYHRGNLSGEYIIFFSSMFPHTWAIIKFSIPEHF